MAVGVTGGRGYSHQLFSLRELCLRVGVGSIVLWKKGREACRYDAALRGRRLCGKGGSEIRHCGLSILLLADMSILVMLHDSVEEVLRTKCAV